MKSTYFTSIALGLLALGMNACDDAEYSEIDNAVYIAEASPMDAYNQQVETQMVDDKVLNRTLTVRLLRATDHDVKVTLVLDTTLIDEYNKKNETTYQKLPNQYLELPKLEAVIKAGKVSAPTLTIGIKPFQTPNQEQYAVPVRISSVEGAQTRGNGDRLLMLLKSPLKQKSVVMTTRSQKQVNFKNSLPADNWTFEFWLKVNNKSGLPTEPWFGTAAGDPNRPKRARIFGDNSSPVNLGGSEMVLLRYWADGVKKTGPTLQCQLDGPYMDSSEFWYPDTWYHIAYTYDGKNLILYKDGAQDVTKEVSKSFNFDKIKFCESFGWNMEVEFTQIRLWNKALSANAIKEGMARQLPDNEDGLIGYWPCDEGNGLVLKDHSANGNDIEFSSNTINWSQETYNFSHPNQKEDDEK